jgi:tetratricopeptide (TPR) repeat protein
MAIGRWIKRIALGVAALLVLALASGLVWWRVAGRDFLYRAIFPGDAELLAGKTIPHHLDAEAFRGDLAFLERELPRLHVRFESAFGDDWLSRRLAELRSTADSYTPTRRQLELIGLLAPASLGTGHTMIVPVQRPLDWRMVPLSTYLFADGLFVTAAADPSLVGARVEAIGGVPSAEALARLDRYAPADNEHSRRANAALLLRLFEPLAALDLAPADGPLTLTVVPPGGASGRASGAPAGDPSSAPSGERADVSIQPIALASVAGVRWSRTLFEPVEGAWSPADDRPRAHPYAVERLAGTSAVLLRLDAMDEAEGDSFPALAGRVVERLDEPGVERLVIDLRANTGGNNQLARSLVDALSAHPRLAGRGSLYVLIGRRTFSAAGNLAAQLERRTPALFVGEPSGFSLGMYGDARSILLPGSKLVARLASRYWPEDLPGVRRAAIEPDLPVELLARHHFEGDDVVLAAALEHYAEPLPAAALPGEALGTYLLSPHHRLRLTATEEGARLSIEHLGPWAETSLHPAPEGAAAQILTTDIAAVSLDLARAEAPVLHWKGASFALQRVDDEQRLPIERLKDGDVEGGVAAFREAAPQVALGSDFEFVFEELGREALEAGRSGDAVRIFELSTELFPQAAFPWASLGDALDAAGDPDGAADAFRQSLAMSPLFGYPRRRLDELATRSSAEP